MDLTTTLCLPATGLSGVLDVIKKDNTESEECCTKMFKIWLDRKPDAGWSHLIATLEKIKLNTAAKKLRLTVC